MAKCPYCKQEVAPMELFTERFTAEANGVDYISFSCSACEAILAIKRA